jgi:MFS transporter, UMF1 family
VGFMVLGCITCILYLTVRDASKFYVISILNIFAGICFGASFLFYNSYIPILARNHWNVLGLKDATPGPSAQKINDTIEQSANTISSYSLIVGFIGTIISFAIAGGIIFGLQTLPTSSGFGVEGYFDNEGVSTYAKQVGVAFVGVWGIIGIIYVAVYLGERPGEPLARNVNPFLYSWKRGNKFQT